MDWIVFILSIVIIIVGFLISLKNKEKKFVYLFIILFILSIGKEIISYNESISQNKKIGELKEVSSEVEKNIYKPLDNNIKKDIEKNLLNLMNIVKKYPEFSEVKINFVEIDGRNEANAQIGEELSTMFNNVGIDVERAQKKWGMVISPEINKVKYTPLIMANSEKEDLALVLGSFIKPFIKDLMVDIIERSDNNKDEITFYFSGDPKFNEDGTVYFNENNLNN